MEEGIIIRKIKSAQGDQTKLNTLLLGLYIISLFFIVYNPSTLFISELIFVLFAISVVIKGRIKFSPWILILPSIAFISIISFRWAILPHVALIRGKSIVQMTTLFFLSYQSVKDEKDVGFLLDAYLIGVFIMYGRILMIYGSDGIARAFDSKYRLGLLVNEPNALGRYSAIAYVICLFKALFNQDKKYYIIGLACIFMAFASGSRQGILILLVGIIVMLFLKSKNNLSKFMRTLLIVLLFISTTVILAETFPIFDRYNRLIILFLGEGHSDGSLLIRSMLIKYGFELFFKKPLVGYGIGQFVAFSQEVFGRNIASHNGFIEVLVSYGILITILYYSVFLKILKGLRKNRSEYVYSNLLFTIFIMLLVSEVAHIGLYDKFTYIFLGIGLSLSFLRYRRPNKC